MSHFEELQKKIQQFVGPQGLAIIQKALNQTNLDWEYLAKADILSRSMLSWLSSVLDNGTVKVQVPSTNISIDLQKNKDKYDGKITINGRDILVKNQDSVYIGTLITTLTEDNVTLSKAGFEFGEKIQPLVNQLVDKFHFETKKFNVLTKNVQAQCPDCKCQIHLKEIGSKLCMCFKALGKNNIHVLKKNDKYAISFGKNWTKDDIKLLMRVLDNALN